MVTENYVMTFITPCFVHGADSKGEPLLNTVALKAQYRFWFRIIKSTEMLEVNPKLKGVELAEKLLQEEQHFFGGVACKNGLEPARSKIRVVITELPNSIVSINLSPNTGQGYFGYGICKDKEKEAKGYSAGSIVRFYLQYPEEYKILIHKISSLIDEFGALGGRSRRGFGAVQLSLDGGQLPKVSSFSDSLMNDWLRGYQNEIAYPFTLGKDKKGVLCWRSKKYYRSYTEVFNEVKVYYTTIPHWSSLQGKNKQSKRLTSPLLIKIKMDAEGYYALIMHLAYKVELTNERPIQDDEDIRLWKIVHNQLDVNMRRVKYEIS